MKKKLTLLAVIVMHMTVSHAQWALIGNAIVAGNFLGTTNAQPLVIKTDGALSGLIDYLSTKANTSFGFQTLASNTGTQNTAMGYQALAANTSGSNNTALGYLALPVCTTGSNNTSIGTWTLTANTTGQGNSAFGLGGLFQNTTGIYNTTCGFAGLDKNTIGNNNVAVGYEPLFNNTSGFSNIGIGFTALYNNQTGTNLVAIGDSALLNQNGGSGGNTAIGSKALYSNTTGNSNTGVGFSVLKTASGSAAVENTAVGYNALTASTTGSDNTAIGSSAMVINTTGGFNIALGAAALITNTTGSDNMALGVDADVSVGNLTNATAIGWGAFVSASNKLVLGNASITSLTCVVPLTVASDGRFKTNIQENVPGLEFINQLRSVTYNLDITGMNKFLRPNGRKATFSQAESEGINQAERMVHTGFIAQEVEAAAKKLNYNFGGVDAPKDNNGIYGLRYSEFVIPIVRAVQQLSQANDGLKATNDSLINIVNSLQSQINDIQQQIKGLKTGNAYGGFGDAPLLKQNAPNPSDNSTLIGYYLPASTGNAQMQITDMTGRNLKTIALNNRGAGQITITAGSLASGTYIYTLIADGKIVDSKKMVLTK